MLALRIIEIIFPIFAVISIGIFYGRSYRPDVSVANRLNMDVFIPCLLFSVLTEQIQAAGAFVDFAFGIAFVILGAGALAWALARSTGLSAKTLLPPLMFPNAGNLGLPLIVLTFGNEAMPTAIVMFIVCNFLHVTIGNYLLGQRSKPFKILLSPMIVAVLLALAFGLFNIGVHPTILAPISMLGNICVPMMLFTLGIRLVDTDLKEWRLGSLIAILSPVFGLLLAFFISQFLQLDRIQQGSLILFGALPPAIMNFMFAERFNQEPARVAAMVLFGNVASIIVLPLVLMFVLTQ